jgi:hypothetical protein
MEQAVFTDISPVKATNISANPQWPKIRVLTLTRQLRRSTMFIAHTTPMLCAPAERHVLWPFRLHAAPNGAG